jgi:hypothetical protein
MVVTIDGLKRARGRGLIKKIRDIVHPSVRWLACGAVFHGRTVMGKLTTTEQRCSQDG